jgi:hypothetical protein
MNYYFRTIDQASTPEEVFGEIRLNVTRCYPCCRKIIEPLPNRSPRYVPHKTGTTPGSNDIHFVDGLVRQGAEKISLEAMEGVDASRQFMVEGTYVQAFSIFIHVVLLKMVEFTRPFSKSFVIGVITIWLKARREFCELSPELEMQNSFLPTFQI